MQSFPHYYDVSVTATEAGPAQITSPGLKAIASEPPMQFDGSGKCWSPETLMAAAVADCFVLTFRAIARISHLPWTTLVCNGTGTVERSDGITRFTGIRLQAHLVIPAGTDRNKAWRVLEKAEQACLVGNSLKFQPVLESDVTIEEPTLAPIA
jgi:organic hydroperoxide reductase OsmC/OhrA